jgi:hypothetical protein
MNLPFISNDFDNLSFPVTINNPGNNKPQSARSIQYESLLYTFFCTNTVNVGGNVYAVYNGTVISVFIDEYGKNHLKIDHGDGFVSEYVCIENIKIKEGEKVKTGQIIAIIGEIFETSHGQNASQQPIAGIGYTITKDGEYFENRPRYIHETINGDVYLVCADTREIVEYKESFINLWYSYETGKAWLAWENANN